VLVFCTAGIASAAAPHDALKTAQWEIDAVVREAFLADAEATVLATIEAPLPASFMNWVRSDQEVREAVFATVSPPDSRILLNLHELHRELGADFVGRYKHLVLGAAVARRRNGVGALKSMHKVASMIEAGVRADGEDAGKKRKSKPVSPEVMQRREKVVGELVAYLERHKISARQAYDDAQHRAATTKLVQSAMGSKAKVADYLQETLVEQDKRPAQRDPFPTVAEFFRYLASHHEIPATQLKLPPKTQWPLFEMTKTPWPLLMPLSKTWPLKESEYIWEKYLGQHGERNYHCYGPYRRSDVVTPSKLEPDTWHWQAWPAVIKQGGVCGTMSTIATGTHTSLGKPSLKAGQPGHSCIVQYNRSVDGYFTASIGQSVSSPYNTKTAWPFSDASTWRAGKVTASMEYHFGLALAMNVGLGDYMNTRIGVHLYRSMADGDRKRHGEQLLRNLVSQNPYNAEVWYMLAEQHATSTQKSLALVELLREHVASSRDNAVPWEERAADQALDDGGDDIVLPPAKVMTAYANVVAQVILEQTIGMPDKKSKEEASTILAFLIQQDEQYAMKGLSDMILQYRIAVDGVETHKAAVARELAASFARKKPSKKVNKTVVARVGSVCAMLPPAESIVWLEELRGTIPADKIVVKDKKGSNVAEMRYKEIHAMLVKALTKSRQKKRARELKAELDALLKAGA
jgi:hypothetical protein